MVWPYRSPFPCGEEGNVTYSNDFYLPSRRLEGGSAPCGWGGGGQSNSRDIFRRIDFVTVFCNFFILWGREATYLGIACQAELALQGEGGEPGKCGDSSGTQGNLLKIRSLRYSRRKRKYEGKIIVGKWKQ
jgi:hypothetical protein